MNRDELVRDTYAHFGLAIDKAQVLEHGLVNAMVVARMPDRGRITRQEIDAFMEGAFDLTLGQLLRELAKYVEVPTDLAGVLRKAFHTRNWLAHDYFREKASDFMTDVGCGRMIDELQGAQQLFTEADERLNMLLRLVRERFGITDEAIAGEARASPDVLTKRDG